MNNLRSHGTDHENYAPASQQSLVDANLTDAAKASRDRAMMALIPAVGRRMVAAFLGRDDYQKVEKRLPTPMGHILMECLPECVKDRGGQIVWNIRLNGPGGVINPTLFPVRADGRDRLILLDGYLFIHFPSELVIISAEWDPTDGSTTACVRSNVSSGAFFNAWERYAQGHNYFRGRAFFADGKEVQQERAYGWDDILLPAATKQLIRRHVEGFLANRLRLRGLGVKTRRGLILTGPPGTGKTLLGKVLSQTLKGVSFIWVAPRHIQGAASFNSVIGLARFVAPTVVFLEDLDLFAEERERNGWAGLGELMQQLDGVVQNEDIICIATTNRLEVIEKALRNRPGRFDRVVKFEAMDAPCRRQFLGKLLAKAVIDPQDVEYLVEATDGYTGAHIEELTNTTYIMAAEAENAGTGVNVSGEAASLRVASTDGDGQEISITRQFIDTALAELQVERKTRLGFQVA